MNNTTLRSMVDFRAVAGMLALLLPLTVWSATGAQSIAPSLTEQQVVDPALNRIEAGPQTITVINPRHRAVFDRDGVRFTPRKGPDWHWQLTQLNGARQAPVAPARSSSDAVDFARSGLIERYLIKANTIEQRYVLERPWPKGQDLVITGAIKSRGRMQSTQQGWVWRDPAGVVTLGQVTVIDAAGKVLPATMDVTTNSSRIKVAAADLAGAAYPVTIDPEIGTNDFRISETGPDGDANFRASLPRVAFNAIAQEYLVVWEGDAVGAGEFEIFGQRLDASGAETGANDFRLSDMGPDGDAGFGAFDAALAFNATDNEYLVVWYGDDDTLPLVDDEREIFGQLFSSIAVVGGGGGCVMNPAATGPGALFPLLVLVAAGYLLRRRGQR